MHVLGEGGFDVRISVHESLAGEDVT